MKPWYQSKTVWTNVLSVAAIGLNRYGAVLPPEYLALGLAAVNLGLRFLTTQAVTVK